MLAIDRKRNTERSSLSITHVVEQYYNDISAGCACGAVKCQFPKLLLLLKQTVCSLSTNSTWKPVPEPSMHGAQHSIMWPSICFLTPTGQLCRWMTLSALWHLAHFLSCTIQSNSSATHIFSRQQVHRPCPWWLPCPTYLPCMWIFHLCKKGSAG